MEQLVPTWYKKKWESIYLSKDLLLLLALYITL
jgi:hypothetical protein